MSVLDDLGRCRALRGLGPVHLRRLAGVSRKVHYRAGHRIFEEGTGAAGCWVITSGQVTLETHVPGRGRVGVETLHAGDLLGWSWLVPPYRWHFSAVAASDVDAVQVDTKALRAVTGVDDAFGHALTRAIFAVLLDRLQTTRARLLDLYRSPDHASKEYTR